MSEQMTKEHLIELTRSERGLLEHVLADIPDDQMAEPGVEGDWSIKDILVHIAVWERRMVRWLAETLRGEIPQQLPSGMTWDDLDQMNEQTYLENRDKPLAEVLSEFHRSYRAALKAVEAVPEADLLEPDRFAWRKGKPLWEMVAANMHRHCGEHRKSIWAWLEALATS